MQFISYSEIYGHVSSLGLEKEERKAGKRQEGGGERMRRSRRGAGQRQVLMLKSCCRLDKYGPSLPRDER